jgi:hypothetical protein
MGDTVGKGNLPFTKFLELGDHILRVDIGAPGSWSFTLRLNHTTVFAGSLASRQQMVGLLGIHNHVS